jgi:hypothetical protein
LELREVIEEMAEDLYGCHYWAAGSGPDTESARPPWLKYSV